MKKEQRATIQTPLNWPNQPRQTMDHSRFRRGTIASAIVEINRETRLLKVSNVIISCNLKDIKPDGTPYVYAEEPKDPAVAVWFYLNKEQHVIVCDRWDTVKTNLLAVASTLQAMRKIKKWGTNEVFRQAFSGFKALSSPIVPISQKSVIQNNLDWRRILEVASSCNNLYDIKSAYRRKSIEVHPDRGGTEEAMIIINRAWEIAQVELG